MHVERNRNGDLHLHMWQHGGAVSVAALRSWAISSGMGRQCDARVVGQGGTAPGTAYGMKLILGAPSGAPRSHQIDDYFAIDGGRLAHATHGFWRDEAGRPLNGFKEADRAARHVFGDDWVVVQHSEIGAGRIDC